MKDTIEPQVSTDLTNAGDGSMTDRNGEVRVFLRRPLATPEAVAKEAQPFPSTDGGSLFEHWHDDWRQRLTRNLSRRNDGRWEPLTWMSVPDSPPKDV